MSGGGGGVDWWAVEMLLLIPMVSGYNSESDAPATVRQAEAVIEEKRQDNLMFGFSNNINVLFCLSRRTQSQTDKTFADCWLPWIYFAYGKSDYIYDILDKEYSTF